MTPARAQTWTAQSGVHCANHWALCLKCSKLYCSHDFKMVVEAVWGRAQSLLQIRLHFFIAACFHTTKPMCCLYLGADLPACPSRPWLRFWVFPAGGFFACDCLPFPLSVLPLKSLFTSNALKGMFVADWFPSVVLGFCWACWSTLAMSIANLVGA